MPKQSAGILLFRFKEKELQVFLIHMGGPFWAKKDAGGWSIPKGEYNDDEDALAAAKREFTEETSFTVDGEFIPLTPIKQSGGKKITCWALEGDCDASVIKSNLFEMEWPPRSGQKKHFPEAGKAAWFSIPQAREKILKGQQPLLEEIEQHLKRGS